jgi:hypothetical protein
VNGGSPSPFDPLRSLEALVRHRVDFVVIGAFAGRLLGSPTVTRDLDVCYSRELDNLERLAEALIELNPRLRGAPAGLPFKLDARSLKAGDSFTFETDAGDLDVLGTPAGTNGYPDLVRASQLMDLDGLRVRVVHIDDLIRMKRAAGRPKDLIEAEVLGALREELDRSR